MKPEKIHNKFAPYWAAGLVVFGILGLSTTVRYFGEFWNGYALDIFGPAWNYILFRMLFMEYKDNKWRSFFSPARTLVIFITVAGGIEMAQYFDLYDATWDPWDLLAYVSLLVPLFILDTIQTRRMKPATRNP
jgi:hypothetical protein